jgi:hypothetical protein
MDRIPEIFLIKPKKCSKLTIFIARGITFSYKGCSFSSACAIPPAEQLRLFDFKTNRQTGGSIENSWYQYVLAADGVTRLAIRSGKALEP